MGRPLSLPVPLAVFLSFSLTASSFPKSSPPPTTPKASPSDLLSVLGATSQSAKVNPLISRDLKSCFKFLVPFTPLSIASASQPPSSLRRLSSSSSSSWKRFRSRRVENELIWWPPEPVLELARLAFDSAGDPDVVHRALDPTVLPVPDVEGSTECRCELTRTPYGRRFISQELNSYLQFLFELIAARGPEIGLNVALNRYDLFHGHLFLSVETGRLGILFHAREYPTYDKDVFPYNMGYCQRGSKVIYDDSMNLRNILWLAPLPSNSSKVWMAPGVLVVLDARPRGIIYRDIIPEYVKFARTIYEEDLGDVAVDINYLNVGDKVPNYQIFMC